jgi:histidinol dehydrogenase
MKIIRFPEKGQWYEILKRPYQDHKETQIEKKVQKILLEVKQHGDAALQKFSQLFDLIKLNSFRVDPSEVKEATDNIDNKLKKAINQAIKNIKKFHQAQIEKTNPMETMEGVLCWRKSVPIEKVGLYIPGGTAPLFSTLLMLAVPAKIAKCNEIILTTPPDSKGKIDATILYCAYKVGIDKIFKLGGAQAIAAMAYGTESIPRVYKIFGPGNQYVTVAKQLVAREGISIDLPAGPSEVVVVADDQADPEFVASDLLAQAEHGIDSQVLLITNDESMLTKVSIAIQQQLNILPRKSYAEEALKNSKMILLSDLEQAIAMVNIYAPEHLILMVRNALRLAGKVTNAGSVFLGEYTPEAAGDYASGTNHTLPTCGYARNYSGVSLDSFIKKITFQSLSAQGLTNIGPVIERMAAAEGMEGHKNSVSVRLTKINRDE